MIDRRFKLTAQTGPKVPLFAGLQSARGLGMMNSLNVYSLFDVGESPLDGRSSKIFWLGLWIEIAGVAVESPSAIIASTDRGLSCLD